MKVLEQRLPIESIVTDFEKSYAEKQLLDSYMSIDPIELDYSCGTCNNCGSGDCASCCSSTDD